MPDGEDADGEHLRRRGVEEPHLVEALGCRDGEGARLHGQPAVRPRGHRRERTARPRRRIEGVQWGLGHYRSPRDPGGTRPGRCPTPRAGPRPRRRPPGPGATVRTGVAAPGPGQVERRQRPVRRRSRLRRGDACPDPGTSPRSRSTRAADNRAALASSRVTSSAVQVSQTSRCRAMRRVSSRPVSPATSPTRSTGSWSGSRGVLTRTHLRRCGAPVVACPAPSSLSPCRGGRRGVRRSPAA